MYRWWCMKLGRRWADIGYAFWNAGLILLVVLFADRPMVDFFYLHG